MPIVETKRTLTFTEEEKELINKVIELAEGIDADFCDKARCCECPFEKFCFQGATAEKIERQMNRIVRD